MSLENNQDNVSNQHKISQLKNENESLNEEIYIRKLQKQNEQLKLSLSTDTVEPANLLAFNVQGRMGRLTYINGMCVNLLVALVPLVGLLTIYFNFRIAYLRAKDFGVSTTWAILIALSCFLIIPALILMFVPGSETGNMHGPKPNKGAIYGAIFLPIILLIMARIGSSGGY